MADGTEPEHPAPLLAVDATSAGDGHSQTATVVPAASPRSGTPGAAWWAVVIAAVALIAAAGSAVMSIRTARREGGDEPPG